MATPCRASGLAQFDNRSAQPYAGDLDMGAIADAFVAYAQPLIDQTDGSEEQLSQAFAMSQLCYNLGSYRMTVGRRR